MGETKKNIFQTIAAVMEDVGAIGKDSLNKQQGFLYRSIDAIYNGLNPAFIKHHLFVVPEIMEQTREERRTVKGGTLLYSICRVKYTFYAEDGSHIEAVVVGEGMDSGDKATNKAMSAAFQYACFQVFCIPTEEMKDPDAETPPQSERVLGDERIKELYAELRRTGIGRNHILRTYNVSDLNELSLKDWENAMKTLKGKPDKPVPTVPDNVGEGLPWNTPER